MENIASKCVNCGQPIKKVPAGTWVHVIGDEPSCCAGYCLAESFRGERYSSNNAINRALEEPSKEEAELLKREIDNGPDNCACGDAYLHALYNFLKRRRLRVYNGNPVKSDGSETTH